MTTNDPGEQWLLEGLREAVAEPENPADEASQDRSYRVYSVWRRWKAEQSARCHTMRLRRIAVQLLEQRIRGDETEVPDGLYGELDAIVAMDATEKPDTNPEMHPAYAEQLYSEIVDDLNRPKRRRR